VSDVAAKPTPPIDPGSAEYWARCSTGELCVQRCDDCGHLQHYPRILCTQCRSGELALVAASGNGRVRSFTVIRRAVSAAFEADVPYVVALIELQEGPTMMANVVNCDAQSVAIGLAVKVVFEPRGEGIQIPQFELL